MSYQAENPQDEEVEEKTADGQTAPDEVNVEQLRQDIRERDEKIKALEEKVADFDRRFVEARAYVKKLESEVDQIRQRADRDLQKNLDKKIGDISKNLLPIIDSFELSLKAAHNKSDFESFLKGVKMILKQVEDAVKSLGLERIPTTGEKFDPNIHEALMNREVDKEEEDGLVVEELKAGYRLGSHVVRPAQVAVGQFKE